LAQRGPGFILAVVNSTFALFFLSTGIIAYFRGPLHWIERIILIVTAISMVVDAIDFTPLGLLPIVIGLAVVRPQPGW